MRFELFALILFFVAETCGRVFPTIHKELTISDGKILGREFVTHKNTRYYAFENVPYAQPPIGPLRLREPLPPKKWEGVLNTTVNTRICHQFGGGDADERENEDCLNLNVYTPVDPDENTQDLPVLVWIHGGSFVGWYAEKDFVGPDYFIDQNLIVVTVNYRLGPLGFLTTDDGVIPANLGLKDQHLALKWVNENIGNFGGDASKVTIAGQSAGGASVGYHLLSEKSEGLFRAAIMHSGSPLICWSMHKSGRKIANILASVLSRNIILTSADVLKTLQSVDIKRLKGAITEAQLLAVADKLINCHEGTSLLWSPVLEDENDENAFVTGMSHERLKNGDFNRVPLLTGINSEEAMLWALGLMAQCSLFDLDMGSFVTANMNMQNQNKRAASKAMRRLYTNLTFALSPSSSLNAMSDCMFTTPVARHAFLQSKYTDVYFYQFSYRGTLGRYVYADIKGANGVAHQEELGYIWHNVTNGDLSGYPEKDIIIHDRVVKLWSHFVKYLNPTAKAEESELKWPKVSQNEFSYMDIDSELTVRRDPRKYQEWSRIYQEFAEDELYTY